MQNKKILMLLKSIVYGLIVSVSLFFSSVVSCTVSPPELRLLGGDYATPIILDWKLVSSQSFEISFTEDVIVESIKVSQLGDDGSIDDSLGLSAKQMICASGVCDFYLSQATSFEEDYVFSGIALDQSGNTLRFSLPFRGFNNRVPGVLFSEIRTEYANPKSEYVELYIVSDGNIAGMEISSAYDGFEKSYELPSVEVKAGDFVVIHMRTLEVGAVSELSGDTYASSAKDSSPSIDIWIQGSTSHFGKDDVIFLKDRPHGKLLDAIMYCRSDRDQWPKENQALYAKIAEDSGIFEGSAPFNAVNSDSLTVTRTLSRQNLDDSALLFMEGISQPFFCSKENWIVVDTGCNTPGETNSSEMYE